LYFIHTSGRLEKRREKEEVVMWLMSSVDRDRKLEVGQLWCRICSQRSIYFCWRRLANQPKPNCKSIVSWCRCNRLLLRPRTKTDCRRLGVSPARSTSLQNKTKSKIQIIIIEMKKFFHLSNNIFQKIQVQTWKDIISRFR